MSSNNDQNKFIVDNLLVPDDNKLEEVQEVEEEHQETVYDNPYFLDVKDEKYFRLFIGSNYELITQKRFNYAAFFLCGIYLLYRKCYVLGAAWTVINLIFLILLPLLNVHIFITLAVILISHIICGFVANQSYVNYVGAKIVEYRSKDKNNLKDILIRKGGTDILVSSVVGIVSAILTFFCLYDVSMEYINKYILVPDEKPKVNDTEIIIDTFKYDGVLKVRDVAISEIVSFPNLVDFNNISKSNNIAYLYGENEIVPKCKMEVNVLDYNTNAKSFIKGLAKYYHELNNNITQVDGKNNWYRITIVENTKEVIYNATVKNKNLILYRVTYIPETKESCLSYYNNIIGEIE
ncbi:MAG: DUF2628 domain-containing protein [Bacilli bacterium]|nr:DUF2628 domain-containing protein [Bacilli bacterium]